MDSLSFRPADLDDAPTVIELVTSAYRGEASKQGWTSEADLIDGQRINLEVLSADIRRPNSVVLLAERGGGLVGCAHVARTDTTHAYFGMFAVHPLGQAQGDGKRILAEAERFVAAEWMSSVMTMTVLDARSELLAFYERRGYRRTATYTPFPYGDERFGLPRRDDLRLEVLEKVLDPVHGPARTRR
ncbi:N-acetyltransferase [Cryobacterium melibiosiphilum]|uniref:N-acetyltransferase n=1 Tax=Cryobacterium melibiosiphilum TaxID=995039 RepID=A0A3A5MII0_9MICO|nr:GNAT family N-acetyltransferase [Cryobacterium melibiosiphilum]RJT85727.1 N-acetyltransferase [Cryobacterium melibiosiphilum]